MDLLDQTWNGKLKQALTGRRLREGAAVTEHVQGPMLAFWGADLGFSEGDVHHSRAYRIYLSYGTDRILRDIRVVVEGELISPCSGYFPEALDPFDFEAVCRWCLSQTEPAEIPGCKPLTDGV